VQGRFARLLPDKMPDEEMRDLARAVLRVKDAGRALLRQR